MICEKVTKASVQVSDKRRTLRDRKGGPSKYIIENNSQKTFFEIDFENKVYEGRNEDTKCDYGIKTDTVIFYIELKGSDVRKGIQQLLATISECNSCFGTLNKKARLIISKFPHPKLAKQTKEYKDLVKILKFIEHKNDHLVIKQNEYSEII